MTEERLNFLLSAITYRAKRQSFIDELTIEARKAGFDPETDMLGYVKHVLEGEKQFQKLTDKKPLILVDEEPTLRASLTEILNSGWDFSSMQDPEGAREMCSEDGDCLDSRLSELSDGQQRFIKAIKRYYRLWKENPRNHRRA
jgi:hypothetical protein